MNTPIMAKPGGQLTSITSAAGTKDSGFFGQLKQIGLDVIRGGAELAPVWAKQQLYEQQEDQLQRVIFDPEGYPRAVWQHEKQTYEAVAAPPPSKGAMNQVMFNIGGYPVTSGGLLAMSAALLVTMLVAQKVT